MRYKVTYYDRDAVTHRIVVRAAARRSYTSLGTGDPAAIPDAPSWEPHDSGLDSRCGVAGVAEHGGRRG